MALGSKAVLQLPLCLQPWITGLGRQLPYLQQVGAGNVVGFSSLYNALNASGGRFSTFWKYGSSGRRTQQEKAQIQLEMCFLSSRTYSQKLVFSNIRWHGTAQKVLICTFSQKDRLRSL